MKITLTLHDEAANYLLRRMCKTYARLCIQSRLVDQPMWDAPWASHSFGEWMRGIDSQRMAYKRSLQSVFAELAEVPQPEWRPLALPSDPSRSAPQYRSPAVELIGEAYAEAFMQALEKGERVELP